MELVKLEKLIEKYENAETSLHEEQVLKEYFAKENIPEHLLEYKAMFSYFAECSTESFTKTIPFKTHKFNWKWLSVAAMVLIMLSIYVYKPLDNNLTVTERAEAEMAYEETQKALQLISQNLNRGSSIAYSGLQEFENTQSKVFKTNE